MADWPCLKPRGDGCALAVAVTPRARRTGADGLHDGCLRVRLAAPPVDGKANEQLLAWLADELGCPQRSLAISHGHSGRRKTVAIALGAARVEAWLARALGAAEAEGAPLVAAAAEPPPTQGRGHSRR